MKKHIITISGNIASGKSEVAKKLSELLEFEVYKASDEFRRLAREQNMSLVEFNKYIESKPEVDKYVDSRTKEYVSDKDNIVVDARLGFHLIPNAYKVFLKANLDKASERLFLVSKERGKEETYLTLEETIKAIQEREAAERSRYITQYGVDILDMQNYDLVIDTSFLTSEQVAKLIQNGYNNWINLKD